MDCQLLWFAAAGVRAPAKDTRYDLRQWGGAGVQGVPAMQART
jgi:hypothetical protein